MVSFVYVRVFVCELFLFTILISSTIYFRGATNSTTNTTSIEYIAHFTVNSTTPLNITEDEIKTKWNQTVAELNTKGNITIELPIEDFTVFIHRGMYLQHITY